MEVDDFLTAGHRFDEFGICIEPLVVGYENGNDRCPVRWQDIEDITLECNAVGSEIWLMRPNIEHTGLSSRPGILSIMARKAKIVRKCCIAAGWKV